MRFIFLILPPLIAPYAVAQAEFETDLRTDLTLVTGSIDDDSVGPEPEIALAELSLSASAEYLLDNGVEIIGRVTFRAQNDHKARPGFAGAVFTCRDVACGETIEPVRRGAFSRLTGPVPETDTGPRGSLEEAFLSIDGGWGELVFGLDQGVGQRFWEGGPTVFGLARNSNPILDPFGTSLSRTRNDISSTAGKVSYVTPRLLGVRAGVSYTPDSSVRRLDLDTAFSSEGVIEPELNETVEVGLQASRHLRKADLRVRASTTWSNTQVEGAQFEDVETYSVGIDVERRDEFRFGLSYLNSTNGGFGDYESFAAGAAYWVDDWQFTLTGDSSEDKTSGLKGQSLTFGVGKDINENVGFAVGYRYSDTELSSNSTDRGGVLLEIRSKFNSL